MNNLGRLLAGAIAVTSPWLASAASADEGVTLSGQVRWTHADGGTHAVTFAPVEIWDAGLGLRGKIAMVETDADGTWTATVPLRADSATRDLYVKVECRWRFGVIQEYGEPVHALRSPTQSALRAGDTATVDVTAGNERDRDTCFSVREALSRMSLYYEDLQGGADPRHLRVLYPTHEATSFFDGNLNILQLDRWDWDVIMHEYGHYIADAHGLDTSPGGDHSSTQNLSDIKYGAGVLGKDFGIRLAWSEGLATYLALSAQQALDLRSLGIPNVGDARYSDTEDLDFSESMKDNWGSLGEDNELTVSRFLNDMFDPINEAEDDRIALGDRGVWSVLDAAKPDTMSEAMAAFLAGRSTAEQLDIGALATRHGVAPRPHAMVATGAAPTFSWDPSGFSQIFRANSFVLRFFDAEMNVVLETQPTIAFTYTPTDEEWMLLKAGAATRWAVAGQSHSAPATGPYISRAERLDW